MNQAAAAAPTTGDIRLQGVQKKFSNDAIAVKNLDFEIRDRELLVLLGPSGCGKSTTLNMLAGLEEPTSGRIFFGSRDVTRVPPEERDISMVFQSIVLYPYLNVQDNILFALRLRKVPREVQKERLAEMANLLGIERYLRRAIHELSGGERQRVAIAKALVKRPKLFLLDEPFSSLDAEMRRELRGELVRIRRGLDTTMLFVTHDQEEALSIADRIAVMNKGELVQIAQPLEIYDSPANMWVARFVGPYHINLLEASIETENGQSYARTDFARLHFSDRTVQRMQRAGVPSKVVLGFRPEYTRLASVPTSDHSLPTEVYTRQALGNEILYELRSNKHVLRAAVPAQQRFEIGSQVHVDFDWDQALLFDAQTEKTILTPYHE